MISSHWVPPSSHRSSSARRWRLFSSLNDSARCKKSFRTWLSRNSARKLISQLWRRTIYVRYVMFVSLELRCSVVTSSVRPAWRLSQHRWCVLSVAADRPSLFQSSSRDVRYILPFLYVIFYIIFHILLIKNFPPLNVESKFQLVRGSWRRRWLSYLWSLHASFVNFVLCRASIVISLPHSQGFRSPRSPTMRSSFVLESKFAPSQQMSWSSSCETTTELLEANCMPWPEA